MTPEPPPSPALTPPSRLLAPSCPQPKEVKDIKEFLTLSKRADAKSVKIKKGKGKNGVTKFKIRCSRVSAFPSCDNALGRRREGGKPSAPVASGLGPPLRVHRRLRLSHSRRAQPNTHTPFPSQFLYTLKVPSAEKAEKIALALPPVLTRKDI